MPVQLQLEKEARTCEKNSPVGTKVSEEGGEVLQAPVEIPLHPIMNEGHGVAGCSHAAHKGSWWIRHSLVAWGRRPHIGTGGCPKEAVTSWEFCTGAGLLVSLASLRGSAFHRAVNHSTAQLGRGLGWRDGKKHFPVHLFLVQNQGE